MIAEDVGKRMLLALPVGLLSTDRVGTTIEHDRPWTSRRRTRSPRRSRLVRTLDGPATVHRKLSGAIVLKAKTRGGPSSLRSLRLISASIAGSLLALAACSSSSEDGGIEKDPASGSSTTTTAAGDTSGGSGGSTATATGSGAGPSADQNAASNKAWVRLLGEHNSDDQQPAIEGAVVPPPRRLLGCAVDAPEIGDRLVYLERTDPTSEGPPDRQFIISLVAGADSLLATATVYPLVAPEEWAGECEPGDTMSLLGAVADQDSCAFRLEMDDASGQFTISFDGAVPAGCMIPGRGATEVLPEISLSAQEIRWADRITDAEGTTTSDPEATAPNDYASAYIMTRRTDLPPVPGQ